MYRRAAFKKEFHFVNPNCVDASKCIIKFHYQIQDFYFYYTTSLAAIAIAIVNSTSTSSPAVSAALVCEIYVVLPIKTTFILLMA